MLVINMFGSKQIKQNIAVNKMLSTNLVSTDMLRLVDYFGSCSDKEASKDAVLYEHSIGNALNVPTLDMGI